MPQHSAAVQISLLVSMALCGCDDLSADSTEEAGGGAPTTEDAATSAARPDATAPGALDGQTPAPDAMAAASARPDAGGTPGAADSAGPLDATAMDADTRVDASDGSETNLEAGPDSAAQTDAGDAGALRCGPLGQLDTSVYINSEAALDAIRGCRTLPGGLLISGTLPARVELPLLESIGGVLNIQGGSLQELDLPALQSSSALHVTSPNLQALRTPALRSTGPVNLTGSGLHQLLLPALTSASGLYVTDNPALTTLDMAASAEPLIGLDLERNNFLREVRLSRVSAVGNDVMIASNAALAWVDLRQLQSVGRSLSVEANPNLTTLQLSALRSAGYNFSIRTSGLLQLDLPALVEVGGDGSGGFVISETPALSEVQVPALERVADLLYLYGNTALKSFSAPKVDGGERLLIEGNFNLARVELPQYGRVDQLRITNNFGLLLVALPSLSSALSVEVSSNRDLQSFDLGRLEVVRQGVRVVTNPALGALRLPLLREVAWDLLLDDNTAVQQIVLTALARVGEGLYLGKTAAERFDLPALRSVGEELSLSYNPALTSIHAPLLESVGVRLRISDNPKLPACQARAVLDRLSTPPSGMVQLPPDPGNCP